jgi:phosphoglycerate dehydrogenase-like enzyme
MNLVIYDPGFGLYEPLLRKWVQSPWSIEGDWGDEAWLRQELRRADAILTSRYDPRWLPLCRHLRAVFYPGAGVPTIDPSHLPSGCVVSNVFEHATPIAEYVFYAMLRHFTQIETHAAAFRDGYWSGSGRVAGQTHLELSGKTISLLGFGTIGQAIAKRAAAFDMRVLIKRSTSEDPGFYTDADVLVIACPLNDSTQRLISTSQLEALKPGALLINIARAEIIDETALFNALSHRKLYAALDTWYDYPSDLEERRHGSRYPFHELANVLVTPHLSAWTSPMIERRMKLIAANLDKLSARQPLDRVLLEGTTLL